MLKSKKLFFLILPLLASLFTLRVGAAQASTDSAKALTLLKASDRARGSVQGGIQWEATVISEENDEKSERTFIVKAQGDNAHVEAIAPSKYKGEVYIFNDRNMWFYKPSLKKPVSISARQKLSGQAANGDIASTNYARDYTSEVEKIEKINGENVYVLMLKGKTKNLTYDKIRYWINEKTKLAIKAEFLTLQGVPFKRGEMTYGEKIKIDGETIPFVSELSIVDVKFPKNKSIIKYRAAQLKSAPGSLFNVNNLTR